MGGHNPDAAFMQQLSQFSVLPLNNAISGAPNSSSFREKGDFK